MTAMQQCGVSEKLSYQATTRQLLVGMTKLNLIDQTSISIEDARLLRSIFRGLIDADTILGASFTKRSGDCITDLVVWRVSASEHQSAAEVDTFTRAATELASQVQPDAPISQGG